MKKKPKKKPTKRKPEPAAEEPKLQNPPDVQPLLPLSTPMYQTPVAAPLVTTSAYQPAGLSYALAEPAIYPTGAYTIAEPAGVYPAGAYPAGAYTVAAPQYAGFAPAVL